MKITRFWAEPSDVYSYTYDDIWKDKLISFDNKSISYDSIGNPLSYNGWEFTWDRGREMSGMLNNSSGQALSFTYNENGIRHQKLLTVLKPRIISLEVLLPMKATEPT